MWLELVILLVLSAVLVAVVAYVSLTAIRNYQAHQLFKKQSPNLPVLPKPKIFSGHAFEVFLASRNWQVIDELHKKYGRTFGFYYAEKPMVCTTDLDLIKTFVIDEPDKHVNRVFPEVPLKEVEFDSIIFSQDDQWRRIRRVFATSLS